MPLTFKRSRVRSALPLPPRQTPPSEWSAGADHGS